MFNALFLYLFFFYEKPLSFDLFIYPIVLSLKSRTGNRENKEGVSDCITFTDWNRGLCNQNSVGGVYYTPEDKRNDVNQIENRQALYALKKKKPRSNSNEHGRINSRAVLKC